jgi:hypothetical protein
MPNEMPSATHWAAALNRPTIQSRETTWIDFAIRIERLAAPRRLSISRLKCKRIGVDLAASSAPFDREHPERLSPDAGQCQHRECRSPSVPPVIHRPQPSEPSRATILRRAYRSRSALRRSTCIAPRQHRSDANGVETTAVTEPSQASLSMSQGRKSSSAAKDP